MARALIVGCGCRGRALGTALLAAGWQVRGTSRSEAGAAAISEAGIEPAIADPDRVATVLEAIDGVAVIYWLLGSATGGEGVRSLHDARLERLLEEVVDTPVRGLVYEGAGTVDAEALAVGARILGEASARWRIPVEVVKTDPVDWERWRGEMVEASRRVLGLT